MSSESSIKTSTIIVASAATVFTGVLAYAFYFDHRRQTDPQFRKALMKETRKAAKAAKEEQKAHGARQRELIEAAVHDALEKGFPTDTEDREACFMNEVGRGESLCSDSSSQFEAALCFYKALKVYPAPKDLIAIYDKTVPKPVIDILAEMIALDGSINVGSFGQGSGPGSATGVDD